MPSSDTHRPSVRLDELIRELLAPGEADSALDAALGDVLGQEAAYTADPEPARAEARKRGWLVAYGTGTKGAWGSIWLPATYGATPILMFAATEPRALSAALLEAMRVTAENDAR